jgi:parallel beta-helix repeat protein
MIGGGYDDDSGMVIDANAAGMVIDKNDIRNPVDGGIDLRGVGAVVSRNRLQTGGGDTSDEGLDVTGSDHRIVGNSVSDWMGMGIDVSGSDHVVTGNKVFGNSQRGIRITSGSVDNTVTDNKVTDNTEAGIAVMLGATGTTVTGNKASKNRVDLCDEGTGSTLDDNDAETTQLNTGTDCPITFVP